MRLAKNFLISNPVARRTQREAVEHKILRYLREHVYSTLPLLQQVAGYTSQQGTRQAMKRLERIDCVRQHVLLGPGQRLSLWGITHVGQALAFDLSSELPIGATFEPSKVAFSTIPHHLDLQRIRLQAERVGWTKWQHGDRMGVVGRDDKRPDAIALDLAGNKVAIECERTIKSPQRYKSILSIYLQAIRAGQFSWVVWISPTEDISRRVQKIILSIEKVPVDGRSVPIEPARHHKHLAFTTYQKWPTT